MKIEYVDLRGSEPRAVVLFGNDREATVTLIGAIRSLVGGDRQRIAVHELPGFEGVDGCQLYFSVGPTNRGVELIRAPRTLECTARAPRWEEIAKYLGPFCVKLSTHSFQDLDDVDDGFTSKLRLVISTHRFWHRVE